MSRRRFFQMLVATVVTVCVLALSGVLSAQGNSEAAFERVKEVQERHTAALMAKPGVVGTAVGLNDNGRHAVLVLLANPGVGGIPQELEGVPVRPMVTGEIYALPKPPGTPGGGKDKPDESIDPTSRFDRPVPIGVSTGHPDITAGTIGCRVTGGGKVYALSNNHVYANENTAGIGDAVIQPGTYDDGALPDDYVGKLAAYATIQFDGAANEIDAAIAETTTALVGKATPSNGYGTPKSTTVQAAINMPVKKYGRTTRLTTGKVYALNATVNVGYSSGTARFVNQIIITPGSFSAGGDSGSLVVADGKGKNAANDKKPVGLLFAGSTLVTIANPIDAVLGHFGVSVDGE